MVSLTIGLFMVLGVAAVFLSIRQTNQVKEQLESSMEAFRYGAYSISRFVRQAESIGAAGVNVDKEPFMILNSGSGSVGCSGVLTNSSIEISYGLDDDGVGALFCKDGSTARQSFVSHLSSAKFECMVTNGSGQLVEAISCNAASAMRVTIGLRHVKSAVVDEDRRSFVVALRSKVLNL